MSRRRESARRSFFVSSFKSRTAARKSTTRARVLPHGQFRISSIWDSSSSCTPARSSVTHCASVNPTPHPQRTTIPFSNSAAMVPVSLLCLRRPSTTRLRCYPIDCTSGNGSNATRPIFFSPTVSTASPFLGGGSFLTPGAWEQCARCRGSSPARRAAHFGVFRNWVVSCGGCYSPPTDLGADQHFRCAQSWLVCERAGIGSGAGARCVKTSHFAHIGFPQTVHAYAADPLDSNS